MRNARLDETQAGIKIAEGIQWQAKWQGCILSPWLFNMYEEYIMQNAGLDESQDGIKTSRRNINKHMHMIPL